MPRLKAGRAVIIGGSLGGLFAANLLRMIGWDVDVYERVADDLATRGAGIATHDEMFDTLRRLGVVIDDTIGIKVSDRVFYDSTGKVIATRKVNRYMSSWVRFYRPLKDLLPRQNYHFGMNFTRFDETPDGVTAHFSDGTQANADLLIGADGIWSAVRAQWLPEVKPEYAGYIAWRGMVEECDFPPTLRDEIVPIHTFCLPEGQYMLTYPVPGQDDDTRVGHRRTNFVWYHPVTPALADYNDSRGLFGNRLVARNRWLGAHLSAHLTKPRHLRTPDELAHRPPDITLREFGAKLCDIPDLAPIARRRQ